MKLNRRKSKVMVLEKRETGVSWLIDEEIVEEVEEFRYLGVKVQLEKMAKKKAEGWVGGVTWSKVNGQVKVEKGRLVWELLVRPSMGYATEMW